MFARFSVEPEKIFVAEPGKLEVAPEQLLAFQE